MNKLNVTPFSVAQIEKFNSLENINAYILGNKDFSLRYVHSYSQEDIKTIKTDVKLYMDMNKIFHNHELSIVETFLIEMQEYLSGIIFSDMAVYQIIKENDLNYELIYSTETTITNKYFSFLANEYGIDCIDIAREINLAEATEINNHKQSKVSFYIHGHVYMYQSLRKLLTNYHDYHNVEFDNESHKLYDEERDLYYPIVENEQGTHVMSGSDLSCLPFLNRVLDAKFDYLKIDGFLYTEADYEFLVNLYILAMNDLTTNYQNVLDTKIAKKFSPGFLFKRTIY